jgi:hypothetical protein
VKFGHIGIPIAIKFFDVINPKLQQFGAWIDQHPTEAKQFFDNLLKVGEGMLIVGGAFKVIAGLASAVTVIRGVASGFSAIAKVAPALGVIGARLSIVASAIGLLYDDLLEWQKFSAQGFRINLWDTIREGLGPLGTFLPRDLPHRSSGAGGHTTVNVILPKDSDAGHARRIANLVVRGVGAVRTDGGYVVPGSYNSVPSLAH